ncbi:HpcH/HpaI aldolase family protein [Actinomadura miaoliensis]|uniref:HpcH/HpaI aldolase/citrate lyase domain-containing protein n=1 Tax=Actinomadura miaoliensis TaxID=430685 RepID=A0ABP7WGC3_9ACTN
MSPARSRIRAALTSGRRVTGTFVKLPSCDVVEICAEAGFDFVVVDLEHSTLTESDAIALVRHADLCGLAALVRIPAVDGPQICRLLENGAAGFQLSMLHDPAQTRALLQATRFAPAGTRSISMANRTARFGLREGGLRAFLRDEAESPPLLVGQIETPVHGPWEPLIGDLDVVFVGVTDLAVSLGAEPGGERLRAAVTGIAAAAAEHGIAFGGWTPSPDTAAAHGLAAARYLVTGSDLQILATGLKAAASQGGNG